MVSSAKGNKVHDVETSVGERGAWVATWGYTFWIILYFNLGLKVKICCDESKDL